MVADMVAFVASQFTTSTWDVGAQELCSVVLINEHIIPCTIRLPPGFPLTRDDLQGLSLIEKGRGKIVSVRY